MQWLLMLIGLFSGYAVLSSLEAAFWGGLLGLLAGQALSIHLLGQRQKELQAALKTYGQRFEQGTEALYQRLLALETTQKTGEPPQAPAEAPEVDDDALSVPADPVAPPSVPLPERPVPAVERDVPVNAVTEPLPPVSGAAPAQETAPPWFDRLLTLARIGLFGGNTVLRVGIVLLFIGLAFLLRYASERAVIPVELRYIGVVAVAIVCLGLGWWLRRRRAAYGLIMQGGGIAVLYLTIFAAMHLHALLSPTAAFVLLVVVTVCAAVLAVVQDSVGLAVAAIVGGFAAPILSSSGGGDHVGLFSYFTLLNIGIFAIAWFKAWRLLNVVGFIGTFGIGAVWGWRSYTADLFASTEPFLILFFLLYVAIGLLFARRRLREAQHVPHDTADRHERLQWSLRQGDYIDGTIMFGPPLIGFGLQAVAVAHIDFGLAFSALSMGLFYLLLALWLRDRTHRTELLLEVCLALGVIFGTLAIPLGLDAQWTASAWAVEGAGLYWLGWHQRRRLARLFALVLQVGAAGSYLFTLRWGAETLLDGSPLGAAMLAAALLFSYAQLRRHPVVDRFRYEQWALPGLACLGSASLLLIPPLCFARNGTVLCWGLIGLGALLAGLHLRSRTFVLIGMAAQIVAGVLKVSGGYSALSGSRWYLLDELPGALTALVAVGVAYIIVRPLLGTGLGRKPLWKVGIVLFLLLAAIDLLVWLDFSWYFYLTVWQGNVLLLVFASLLMQRHWHYYAGLALQLAAGCCLFCSDFLFAVEPSGPVGLLRTGWWASLTLALAGLVGAGCLRRKAWPHLNLAWLSDVLLAWGIAWWLLTILNAVSLHVPARWSIPVLLLSVTVSCLLWQIIAKGLNWRFLALAGLILIPVGLTVLLRVWLDDEQPLQAYGWLVWPIVCVALFFSLRYQKRLLPPRVLQAAHVLACWLVLILAALVCRSAFMQLAEGENAWGWLGWSLVPGSYLLIMSMVDKLPWPVAGYPRAYRLYAAIPVAVCSMLWFWMANLSSDGSADPLPYLPLINPLELALAIILFACYYWAREQLPDTWLATVRPWLHGLAGVSGLALLTMAVCRMANHLFGVAFESPALMSSMVVQTGLSVVWTLSALALMIGGSRFGRREPWMTGAALIAVVVVKLFFVELGNTGSLERIVSFIGVGILLLVVGYFSPLPPKKKEVMDKGGEPT